MSKLIKNSATIKYNGNQQVKTCDVSTLVEPSLYPTKKAITKASGVIDSTTPSDDSIVGKDRTIIYEITLNNYSSIDFTNLVVKDKIELPSPHETSFELLSSTYTNVGTLPNLEFHIDLLPKNSSITLSYEIKLDDSVPVNTVVRNEASVEYDQNPSEAPQPTNPLNITVKYTETTVEATKTAPSSVLSGQTFSYTLTFANTGDTVANVTTIEDKLPDGFTLDTVEISVNESDKVLDTDYSMTTTDNNLIITAIDNKLNIEAGQTLTAIITGTIVI